VRLPRRLPAIGLRTRLVAALVATAAATLAVAALALLSPLEHRLRNEEVRFLSQSARQSETGLRDLDKSQLRPHTAALNLFASDLERRTGARVVVFDDAGRSLVDTDPDAPPSGPEGGTFADVREATRTGRRKESTTGAGSGGSARIAQPVNLNGDRYVIALRGSLVRTQSAVRVVRDALVTAAIVGLAIAFALGLALATTLLRRLRRLRDAANRISVEGLEPDLPRETRRDEVGELARAMSAMQHRLRQEENARRAFVATASHELRTPLASLGALLELVEDDLQSHPADVTDAAPRVTSAREQTRRLIGLANDLLELTRLDTGFQLRTELIELHEISRAVLAEFVTRAADRNVLLDLESEASCWVLGDPGAIARIARILVDNALRFGPRGDPILVEVSNVGDRAVLAVQDRGPGVPDDERDLVFERFRRGSDAGTEGGFGLGLAIGRELAERMGGELVLAESEAGARFELRLTSAPSPMDDGAEAKRLHAA
jgi:signal transduction histidine kinase